MIDLKNNPSISELLVIYNFIKQTKFFDEDTQVQVEELLSIVEFNNLFKDKCWVLNDFIPKVVYLEAVKLAKLGNFDSAESVLVLSIPNTFERFIQTLEVSKEFNNRRPLIECAIELYLNKNYIAVVPLLLLIIDGIFNDISVNNKGLFAADANLDVIDSFTQIDDALSYIHQNYLTKSRKTTNTNLTTLPFRNGILHGRDLNFGNELLAAKCWSLLLTLRTWRNDKKDEQDKQIKLEDVYNISEYNAKFNFYLNEFNNDRQKLEQYGVAKNAASDFFEYWKAKQWGRMVPFLWHTVNKKASLESKNIKEIYTLFSLQSYNIENKKIISAASINIYCHLNIMMSYNEEVKYYINLSMVYSDDNGDPLPAGFPGGCWRIYQNSLSEILFKSSRKNTLDK